MKNIWTLDDALWFANASAAAAFDDWRPYGTLQDAIDSHRENVRDTLQEYGAGAYEAEAFECFDVAVTVATSRLLS